MIDIAQHGAGPAWPPRPDGRRHIIDDRDRGIARAHMARHAMGEVRTIDDDQNIRLSRHHGIRGLPDQPQDLRQLHHDAGKADDRQFLDRKQRAQPLARHGAAADAFEFDGATEPLAQHLHQPRAKAVAGFFGGDQEYPAPDTARHARRAHAATPVTNNPALSAASIMVCGSATTVLPAIMAMPASFAAAAPSTVRGPIAGKSWRRSWPALGAFISTPRAAAARIRPRARSCTMRASNPSVPSMSSIPTTWPSITTAACPMSKGLSARSTSRPFAMSASACGSGVMPVTQPSGISRSGAASLIPTMRNPWPSRIRPIPDNR